MKPKTQKYKEYSPVINALLSYLENLSDEDKDAINYWLDADPEAMDKLIEITFVKYLNQ